ncbi:MULTISPECIES: hypothetical protein [unclassified Methylophaga]|jgi:hemolysin III|uniref:hypothetical protein n=1 Tax=unclassified Methylophaga TaxID=2629249 RepID=UPI0025F69535|nr:MULTISPECIES: hypothetical protein [unclassified Methylophaga]|tara:strand:- start:26814 stop:27095 length:282 start_codon:yes stop_codon:yes gene_type:complete
MQKSLTSLNREQSAGEEIANAVSHGTGLVAALIGMPFLIVHATRLGETAFVVGVSVFCATMILLYLAPPYITHYLSARQNVFFAVLNILQFIY